jgi:uncharacterized protein YggE
MIDHIHKTALMLVVLLVVGSSAGAAQDSTASVPIVVTSGEGVIKAAPDRAFVTISVEATAPRPVDAQKTSAESMASVLQQLAGASVPKDAIRTTAYDLQPEFDYVNGKQVSRGYKASNVIEVRVDQVDRTGDVISAATTGGATAATNVRFDLRDRESLERDALKRAVADARARADAAAAGAGRTVDHILRIQEAGIDVPMPMPQFRMVAAEAMAAPRTPPPPIIAGEIEVRASVILTAVLK